MFDIFPPFVMTRGVIRLSVGRNAEAGGGSMRRDESFIFIIIFSLSGRWSGGVCKLISSRCHGLSFLFFYAFLSSLLASSSFSSVFFLNLMSLCLDLAYLSLSLFPPPPPFFVLTAVVW